MSEVFERPDSSLCQSYSTTDEKEGPYLTVSVTIKAGANADRISQNSPEIQEYSQLNDEHELEDIGTESDEKITSAVDDRNIENPNNSTAMDSTQLLPGWKGYSSNIYIQPIIVSAQDDKFLQSKESTRLRRNVTINELRRQMQLRQASEWVTKHNQRIYLKGSLKMGKIPPTSSDTPRKLSNTSRSSNTLSKSYNSPKSCQRNNPPTSKKSRLAKGFVCRSWAQEYAPGSPRSPPPLKEALSVRSYINISNPFWLQAQTKKQPNIKKTNKVGQGHCTESTIKVIEDSLTLRNDAICNTRKQTDTQKHSEMTEPGETTKLNEIPDYSSISSESITSAAESVNLADFLFKTVFLQTTKSSTCKENSCHCLIDDGEFEAPENLPKVEIKSIKSENDPNVDRTPESTTNDTFPNIISNSVEKGKNAAGTSRIHRPNTVNLTFNNCSSTPKYDNLRRSHSSKMSQSF